MRFQRISTRWPRLIIPQTTIIRYKTTTTALIDVLKRNKEISAEDAVNELRWIRQAIREDPALCRAQTDKDTCLTNLIKRRGGGEPLQYVLGTTDFGPLTLRTKAPVLIPRPETAYITELFASHLLEQRTGSSELLKVLDLCSGSGCIALLLKHLLGNQIGITGRDIARQAIALAYENAQMLGMDINFQHGDIWGNVSEWGRVDVLVSNPPYIPRSEWDGLEEGVKGFEDPAALIGDPSDLPSVAHLLGEPIGKTRERYHDTDGRGLAFYRRIAEILPTILTPGAELTAKGWRSPPRVAVEIGYNQGAAVEAIFAENSRGIIKRTEVWKDQYDVDRMVVGWE